ncbi:MAG: hypothetical protein NTW21_31045 [Verrucomicrobia bacterium]|nr:hypothetical protein [Verrucomicrobiota bacterium]
MPRLPAPRFKARQRPAVPAQAPETPEYCQQVKLKGEVGALLGLQQMKKP